MATDIKWRIELKQNFGLLYREKRCDF